MTILIKGMEMPEGCRDCELGGVYVHCDDNGVYTEEKYRCSVTFYPLKDLTKRHEHCPLIEVPTPHGRLIDINDVKNTKFAAENINQYERWWNGALDSVIENAPTVIEAEEDER